MLRDREFVNLVTAVPDYPLPAADLLNKQVFLYDYIDSTVKDEKVYVCIEADDGVAYSCAVSRFDMYIYIAVPKYLMDMNGQIRRDAIAQRIDTLINGSTDYGFGKLERKSGGRIRLSDEFRGRVLHYTVEDWNRHNTTL